MAKAETISKNLQSMMFSELSPKKPMRDLAAIMTNEWPQLLSWVVYLK
ncbi:MAG: hypothetical protein ABIW47_13510 [Ginsengibacter sp.]